MQDESPREQKRKTFLENAADFTKKHGMKICAGIFLGANVMLLAQPLWDPEKATFLRNTSAALFQYAANCYQLKGNRAVAYDYSVAGGASHALASLDQGLYFGTVMWSLFTEASYRASHWPQQIKEYTQQFFGNIKKPKIFDTIGKAFKDVKEAIFPKKNPVSEFINNKVDLLKDPHARAGCVALVSNVGQFIEAAVNHRTELLPIMPFWILAAGFYAGHGLLHAKDKKAEALKNTT